MGSLLVVVKSVILLVCILSNANSPVEGTCGYASCPQIKSGYINVHLVPHSHDDVGWLKTVDQYYYGDNNRIQLGAVQYTLDSVVEELKKSPDRRFIYVETAFFWRWWTNQDGEMQGVVRRLVNTGQLEFILGGWVMNDEACSHYNSMVDQMTLGLRFLNETFGECGHPKVAWQIDPFGHSREQASIFAQMGYDGLFFGRLDYQDKEFRKQNRDMEMIWSGSPNNLGKEAWLFTGALYNGYNPPDGYCFDIFCEDDPINDDPKLFGYNLEDKVNNFIKIAKEWADPYDTGHVLMTMGSDFQYMAAHTWYKNLDKLIKYVNRKQITNSSRVNLLYSTPSCYLQAVHNTRKPLTVKSDDFFPYASDPHAFWTGYFTSRPTFKYFVQKANNFLQACKQLAVGAFSGQPEQKIIDKVVALSEPVAIAQHHDAVSGTAKQHVTDDYSTRLTIGLKSCEGVLDQAFRKLQEEGSVDVSSNDYPRSFSGGATNYEFCHLLNISTCAPSEAMSDFVVSVYNPLGRDIQHAYIRIPVSSPLWDVQGESGFIPSQIINIPQPVLGIPGRRGRALYELVFSIDSLPGLSLSNFQITRNTTEHAHLLGLRSQLKAVKKGGRRRVSQPSTPTHSANFQEDFMIKNSNGLAIVFDSISGLLKSVVKGSVEIPIEQNFFYYLGMSGDNSKFEKRASGAYIFRPNTTCSGFQPTPITEAVFSYEVYKGPHVTEVHQVFTEWISQVIRLYNNADLVEFEWLIGPVPVEDNYGKEIITRYTTNMQTKGVFFTDANGRQLVKRKRDTRATWPYKKHENVSGNYYPVNSRILISSDEDLSKNALSLVILNDRAQGGTSMNDGEVELMLHRRLLFDDAFGVGEALNETAYGDGLVARGKHWMLLAGEGTDVPVSRHREAAQNIFMEKIMGFTDASLLEESKYSFMRNSVSTRNLDLSVRSTIMSELSEILPSNIHLLTVEPLSPSQFILRLEHFYERGEDPELSKPVTIRVEDLKRVMPFVKSLKETTLGGNQWKEDVHRFDWIPTSDGIPFQSKDSEQTIATDYRHGDDDIVLNPMEIRTFVVNT